MSYCVNCGKEYAEISGICPNCHSDQRIPNEIIEVELSRNKAKPPKPHDLAFGFPGEKSALILSVVIALILAAMLGTISFGLFFGVLIVSLIGLKLKHLSSQKNMIRVSENSFKDILSLAKLAAFRLNLGTPEVYVVHDPQYNAYTMGFYKYGFVVLNSELVSDFNPSQLMYVIGHELGHIKRYHTTWLSLLNPARAGSARFVFAPVMGVIFNVWSVKAEYTADQAGLIACKDLDAAIGSLLKIAGGQDVEKEVGYSKIARPKGEAAELLSGVAEYLSTHPFIENRIKQLMDFSSRMQLIDGNK